MPKFLLLLGKGGGVSAGGFLGERGGAVLGNTGRLSFGTGLGAALMVWVTSDLLLIQEETMRGDCCGVAVFSAEVLSPSSEEV